MSYVLNWTTGRREYIGRIEERREGETITEKEREREEEDREGERRNREEEFLPDPMKVSKGLVKKCC